MKKTEEDSITEILVEVFEDRSFLVDLYILIPTMKRSQKSRKSANAMDIIKQKLIYIRELFFGRTKKQTRPDKPSFIGKAMLGMYGLFTVYSFILFAVMNAEDFQTPLLLVVLKILCFGDPYAFGIALTFALFILSLIFCNEKILVWTYTKYRYLKQILIFFATTGLFFGLAKYLVLKRVDLYSVLLIFAMIWLIFQSVRIYSAALGGGTKMEIRMSSRYSPIRYLIAYITPFIILGVITVIAWIFRYYIVIFTLDYIAVWEPTDALIIYRKEMETIMPMIYTGLLSIFILMITQIILSKKKGSTARAGTFDNLVFGIISMVMFLYSIYNIALYLFLDETFLHGFSSTTHVGTEGNGSWFFFVEFLIALVFFLWIVLDLTNIFGDKGFLFFNKDGFVIFLMSTLIAQTTARLGLVSAEHQVDTTFSDFIKYDYVVLPWLILLFLGVTIVIYWIKPQQVSIFLRTGKAVREGDDQSMQRILKFLKREFIRRGEKFIISPDLTKALRDMTGLSISTVWSLIHRLDDNNIDIQLLTSKDERGEKIVYFEFLPITATEKYQKGKDAKIRGTKIARQKLFIDHITDVPKQMYIPKKTQSSSSQDDLFIQALSVQYSRKVQDEARKSIEEENIIINQAVDEHTKEIVYGILQIESIQRISQVADYRDDINFRISDVSDRIARSTKLPIARIYTLLNEMAGPEWNFTLSSNLENKATADDRLIEIFPINDWTVYNALVKHRPTHLKPIRVFMQKLFDNNIRYKRSKLENLPPLVYPDENMEFQRSYISRWWAKTIHFCGNHFLQYQQCLNPNYLSSKFDASIKLVINAKMQEYLEQHAKDNKPAYSPK